MRVARSDLKELGKDYLNYFERLYPGIAIHGLNALALALFFTKRGTTSRVTTVSDELICRQIPFLAKESNNVPCDSQSAPSSMPCSGPLTP